MVPSIQSTFTLPLLHWYDLHGRKNLPWQHPRDAYRVWLSEIMLQQTQVKTVIPYFTRFLESFPSIHDLARASEDEVLALWSGLGYYSRGRNLHKTAIIIDTLYQGQFPEDMQLLNQLPGIGQSTAAAITSQAFNQPTAILDGNVKRVLSRYFLIKGFSAQTTATLWQLANQCMSQNRAADYTQAIMDLGATCCTSKKPNCISCPLQATCLAKQNNAVTDYPTPKPKKEIPIKHQQFLLMHDHTQSIYLEKRPANGIWGGLWCPPSIETGVNPSDYIQNTYALEVLHIHSLINIKHTFSHFKLHINALSIGIKATGNSCFEHSGRWFSPAETIKLGLAKPINDMIKLFCQTQLEEA